MSVLANTDSYKLSHKGFMNEGTEVIYSNLTPRSDAYFKGSSMWDGKLVWFGLQHFINDYLIKEWNEKFFNKPKEEVISKFKRLVDAYLGEGSVPMEHFEELHDLGYLPVSIKALPEGSRVPMRVPVMTIRNTHPKFAWVTNYLETIYSTELWKASTTATTVYEYRRLVNHYAMKTTGSTAGTEFQVHGFEFRGMSGRHDAAINGAAFLTSSCGTDTIPALEVIEDSYYADITKEFIATSVPASEHSIACLGTELEGELESYRRWITESYPTGIVSLVSDTYDYFKVLTEYLPALKDDILARPENALGLSKVVIRPDCYSEDTYIYTSSGWKLFKDLTDEDFVAQVLDNGSYEFVKPTNYVSQKYKGIMHSFKDHHGKVDLLVTPNHRMIIEQSGKERIVFAEDMNKTGNYKQKMIRSASAAPDTSKLLSDVERLKIAFQADGSYITDSTMGIRFSFAKSRKRTRLEQLLNRMEVEYRVYDLKDGRWEIHIKCDSQEFIKDFSWVDITSLTKGWCQEFIEELSHWDSCIRSDTRFKFDTCTGPVIDVVEHIAIGAGYGVLISEYEDTREEHFSNVFTANITLDNRVGGQSWVHAEEEYEGKVYCVQVPTGRLLVKRNRCTMVCGNSGDPVKIICGEDYKEIKNGPEDFEEWREWVAEEMDEQFRDNLIAEEPHPYEVELYKLGDKYYEVKYEPDLNRYDKQYYYVDNYGSTVSNCEFKEVERTPEQKGSMEILWEVFGGEVNEQGYKVLDSHIGLIYGDSITIQRCEEILKRLEAKGFATTSVVFGVGSYTMQYVTRDTFGMAVKATWAQVNGKGVELFKDPKTDNGVKKSAKGLLQVFVNDAGEFELKDQCTMAEESVGELKTVFYAGKLMRRDTFSNIRNRLWEGV